jgi:mRNA-degrading endonuclease RelE of RelBE toxin-antitoxin system
MRFRFELSSEAQRNLSPLPRGAQTRIARAIDEMDGIDDSLWSNVKALQGPEWKGRFRKKVGPYRIIFTKFPNVAAVVISAISIRSKDTYK